MPYGIPPVRNMNPFSFGSLKARGKLLKFLGDAQNVSVRKIEQVEGNFETGNIFEITIDIGGHYQVWAVPEHGNPWRSDIV